MSIRSTRRCRLTRAAAVLAVVAVVCVALLPAGARADADPASDVLLALPVFYPYAPPVARGLQDQLQGELAELARRGLDLKVAIIGSPVDLGAIPALFAKPQAYADFLEREISFEHPQPLLVVMPQGFGVASLPHTGALDGLKVDATQQSNGLTRSAIVAVARIAHAAGKPVSSGLAPGTATSSGGGSSVIGFAALAVLLVGGASTAVVLRRRSRPAAVSPRGPRQPSKRSRPGRSGKER